MKLTIEIDDEVMARMQEFKKIFDIIMGEDAKSDDYASLLINFGLEKMLRDVVPEGQEWLTLNSMFVSRPDAVSEFISEVLENIKKDKKEKMKEIEERMRKSVERYIR